MTEVNGCSRAKWKLRQRSGGGQEHRLLNSSVLAFENELKLRRPNDIFSKSRSEPSDAEMLLKRLEVPPVLF